MMAFIGHLPPEILLHIFKYLVNLRDILTASVSLKGTKHEVLVSAKFLQPYLTVFAHLDTHLNKSIEKLGWTENCTDYSLIMSLWKRHKPFKGRYHEKETLTQTSIVR